MDDASEPIRPSRLSDGPEAINPPGPAEEPDEDMLRRDGEALAAEAARGRRQTAEHRRTMARLAAERDRLRRAGAVARSTAAVTLDRGRASRGRVAFILREDPDLAEALPADQREAVTDQLRARVLRLDEPSWELPDIDAERTYGLLILDGLVARRVRLQQTTAVELLGGGDILRPWDETSLWGMAAADVQWIVFEPARVALLDERITRIVGRWPELTVAFSARLLRRARSAEYLAAVSHLPRVDERLLALLWHLAGRWGRVTPRGVCVPLRLTHHLLGEIVGARRPSVTLGLQRLTTCGQLARDSSGYYVLTGDPPGARQTGAG